MTGATDALETEVRELLNLVLKLSEDERVNLVRRDVAKWDSLKHMEVVFALEDRYGVRFHESEFAALDSPPAIAKALREHHAA